MEDMICMALGGRIAEEVCFGRITTGARDDLDRVTKILYSQITKYGMGQIGPISYPRTRGEEGMSSASYSEETAEEIDKEVRLESERLYSRAREIIIEKKDLLLKLAEELLKKEVLSRSDVAVILGPRPFETTDLALDMYDGNVREEKVEKD
jgi:AFG3 family protein